MLVRRWNLILLLIVIFRSFISSAAHSLNNQPVLINGLFCFIRFFVLLFVYLSGLFALLALNQSACPEIRVFSERTISERSVEEKLPRSQKKLPPSDKKWGWGGNKNAPQASIVPPGVFVYTGTAIQFISLLFKASFSAVFIRRPTLWRRGIIYRRQRSPTL